MRMWFVRRRKLGERRLLKFFQPNCESKQSIIRQELSKADSRIRILKPFALRGLIISLLFTQFGAWTHGISSAYADPLQNPTQAQSNGPDSNDDLAKRAQEIARIQAEIDKNWKEYQKGPRRKFIGRYTKEYRLKQYYKEYRLKQYYEECLARIEKVTFLNPSNIYFAIQLSISIKPDGNIENIEVSRPSGQHDVDEFAIHLIETAAPFPPFPPEITKDTDFLTIVGIWNVPLPDRQGATQ